VLAEAPVMKVIIITIIQIVEAILIATAAADKFVKQIIKSMQTFPSVNSDSSSTRIGSNNNRSIPCNELKQCYRLLIYRWCSQSR